MSILSGRDETKKGLSLLMFAMLAYGVSEAVSVLQTFSLARAMEEDAITTSSTSISGLFVGCFAGIIGMVGLVLLIVGAYKVYQGSKTKSSKHAKKVKIGGVLIIIGFLGNMLFGGVAGVTSAFSSGAGSEINGVSSLMTYGAVVGAITGILLMGGLLLLIYELAKDKKQKYILFVIGAYIIMRVGVLLLYRNIPAQEGHEMAAAIIRYGGIATGLESIFSFIFAGIYYVVKEDYVKEMSKKVSFGSQMDRYQKVEENYREESLVICPRCHERKMEIAKNGWAHCKACEYSTDDYYDEFKSED